MCRNADDDDDDDDGGKLLWPWLRNQYRFIVLFTLTWRDEKCIIFGIWILILLSLLPYYCPASQNNDLIYKHCLLHNMDDECAPDYVDTTKALYDGSGGEKHPSLSVTGELFLSAVSVSELFVMRFRIPL